jgi:hypothetical protein
LHGWLLGHIHRKYWQILGICTRVYGQKAAILHLKTNHGPHKEAMIYSIEMKMNRRWRIRNYSAAVVSAERRVYRGNLVY